MHKNLPLQKKGQFSCCTKLFPHFACKLSLSWSLLCDELWEGVTSQPFASIDYTEDEQLQTSIFIGIHFAV